MPSAMSKEDLRALIYSSGVRDPRKLDLVMRSLQAYAWRLATAQEEQREAVTYVPLNPGEWLMTLEVTCCQVCTKVRRWEHFHADRRHPTLHKTTCKDCRKKENENTGEIPPFPGDVRYRKWLCSSCRQRKVPAEFTEDKQMHPRRPGVCAACEKENDDE